MMTTSTISMDMLPPFSSLSHYINFILLNMHPLAWMCLTWLQQPGRHLFISIVYPFFTFFLKVFKNLENMVNIKWSDLTGIEAWAFGLIVRSNSRQTAQIPCLDLDCLPCVVIRDISSNLFVFTISYRIGWIILGYLLLWPNIQSIKVMLLLS